MELKRSVVLAGLTVVLGGLTACAVVQRHAFRPGGEKTCDSSHRCEVKVSPCPPPPMPEFETIRVRRPGATIIVWEAPSGFVFTENGIRFKNNNGDIDPRPGRIMGGAKWQVVDTPRSTFEIKYYIQLQNVATGAVCTGPDPVIAND